MLKFSEDKLAGRIEYFVKGWVSSAEYREAMQYLKERPKHSHQAYTVLEVVESFYGMAPHLLVDDLIFRITNVSAFKKVAIVTDVLWIKLAVKALSFIAPNKLRHFPINHKAAAIHWLEN